MEIIITRIAKKAEYTIGRLTINGHRICDTLEPHCIDWNKDEKVLGKTAIPKGRYRIMMKLSRKFGMKMPYLEFLLRFLSLLILTQH